MQAAAGYRRVKIRGFLGWFDEGREIFDLRFLIYDLRAYQ
jgi:hypothetical protein